MRNSSVENWAIDPGAVRAWQRGVVPAGAQRGVGDRATRGRAAYVPPNVVAPSVPGDTRESAPGNAPVGIDWFALDFNEELSAFHGGLLRRQTAFTSHALAKILETYPPGTPVVIAGHSMGGVVARGALLELGKEGAYGSSVERHAHNAGDAACRLARGDGAVRGSRPSRHQRRVDR